MRELNKDGISIVRPALVAFAALTVICGVAYTAAVTGIAQLCFPSQSNGSVVSAAGKDGSTKACGSALLGQEFTKPEYLIGRTLGATNLSPTGKKQRELVEGRVAKWRALDPENVAPILADLVTASGSGVDPNISPEAAEYQVARIAKARGIEVETVRSIIAKRTNGRFLGIFGEPAVNVLEVNLALDGTM